MKQTIRLTESELRRAIAQAISNNRTTRGVVNEVVGNLKGRRMLREGVEGHEQEIADYLSQYINKPKGYIKWDGSHGAERWFDNRDDGVSFLVFNSYQEATEYAKNDEILVDYVDGATEDETWYNSCKKAGCVDDVFPNGLEGGCDYEALVRNIVELEGPEWFYARYDGEVIDLPFGECVAFLESY